MKKDNLVKRLGKKVLPYVLAGSLSLSSLLNYRCSVTEPEPPVEKPVAVLKAEPKEGYVPLFVSFDGSQSHSPSGYIQQYLWEFGDGKTESTTHSFTNYLYEQGGEYNAGLVVVDNKGQRSNKALERILAKDDIVSLGEIAFWSNPNLSSQDGCPSGTECNEDIYSGEIVIKNNNIELRNVKRLTTHPGQDLEPSWSYDGNEILFTSHRTGGTAVWRMNTDGSNQRDITSNIVERARQAHWGSNEKIVVAYRDSGYAGIGMIDPDENLFTPIYSEIETSRVPVWPKWSSDCSKIAFGTYVNGNWEVFLMNADGSNLENLTNHPAMDSQPEFLPDGNKILFSSDRTGILEIYSKNLENGDIEQITYGTGYDPTISPQGDKIVFISERDSWYHLYMQNLETGEVARLTFTGANRYPSWKPKKED
ncbi:PKD domain-containing protein [Candidatus Pacearchaeota archaeon]|nr:PKD domain-containing protein [Candidatus Pacearchaeota archaeon]